MNVPSVADQYKEQLEQLQHECPMVTVEGTYERSTWQLRGKRSGNLVLQVQGQYFKPARKNFQEAYAKYISMLAPGAPKEFNAQGRT